MDKDKNEIYEDEKLLNLRQRMAILDKEEFELFFSNIEKTSSGRTREDVARDMIIVYEETNEYLKNKYSNNAVATSWIGVNQFSANLLKEGIPGYDSHASV